MGTVFSTKEDLISYLINKVDSSRMNGNNCIFVDSITFKRMAKDRDAIISTFQERNENIEMRPCARGFYDIIITWKKE